MSQGATNTFYMKVHNVYMYAYLMHMQVLNSVNVCVYMYIHVYRACTFMRKRQNSCLGWDLNPQHTASYF